MKRAYLNVAVLLLTACLTMGFFGMKEIRKPLNETEQAFVGKWAGERDVYKWEIERFADRTFEIVFREPDFEDPTIIYTNYAIGNWRVENNEYFFEWTRWYGDEGDFSGESMEPIKSVAPNEIITLSEGEDIPENVEVRVEVFKMQGWKLKPETAE